MAETSISWTTFTANPWEGCTEVSPGCDNCYAKAQNKWLRGGKHWSKQGPRLAIANWRKTILKAKRVAIETGHRVPVFVASIADIFEKSMPLENMEGKTTDDIRQEFFEVAERTKECTFLLLTKRAVNINKMIPAHWRNGGMPDNIWFGASVCTQDEADKHIPHLLAAPGIGNKFLSMEPLLGRIDITNQGIKNGYSVPTRIVNGNPCEYTDPGPNFVGVDWVIVGGEATHKSKCRPMQPEWVNQIRSQCESNDVPFFFKQWGNFVPTGAKTIGGDEVMQHVKNPRCEELPYGSGIIVQRVPTKITAPLK